MRIYLVRHGQSLANVDKEVHSTMADHAIPLSDHGKIQAVNAGGFLGDYIKTHQYGQDRIRLWTSPYERTRQTSDGIVEGILNYHQENPLDFTNMDRDEDIRLCEQQFGLFDGVPDELLPILYPKEHAHYQKCETQKGRFWARMPLGESRFDVANRVHQAFGTFHRDNDKHGIDTIIVVCHGVTLRAFVMQWLRLTPEWFDDEPNPGNCDIRLIDDGEDKGYIYRGLDNI